MESPPADTAPTDPEPLAVSTYPPQSLRFTGSGSSYFGIWIVNLLLTIVTLGIYSAWAKVRRLQYFYRNTELAGSSFDFHGSAIRILIGRAIALAMLICYRFTVTLQSLWIFAVLGVLAVAMPWLLRNSFRFRLYNSSWRGTRFHFRGTVAGSYQVFLLNGFLALITLYLLTPFAHQRLKAYEHGNGWFGQTRFSFHARIAQFYLIYLMALAAIIAIGILFVAGGFGSALAHIFAVQNQTNRMDPRALIHALLIIYGLMLVLLVSVAPTFQALVTNLIWNNTRLGEHCIECRLAPLRLIWITVSNFVLVAVTLGLYIPWAMVRLTRYRLECIRLLPASDLQEFVAAEPEAIGAAGEEAASLFDFDIAL